MAKYIRFAILIACFLGKCTVASACSCFGGLLFDDHVKHSDLVLLGRVQTQGRQALSNSNQSEVGYLDLEVIQVYKGMPRKPVVRVWDSYVGTDCGGGFAELSPGMVVGFVVEKNEDPDSSNVVWGITGIRPGAADYLIGACSEYWKVFRTELGARWHMARLAH